MRRLPLRSPPRVRGKVIRCEELARVVGITPACAGKSGRHNLHTPCSWDHPRVCGEKLISLSLFVAKSGITPACAGKSRIFDVLHVEPKDHPRVCGEKPFVQAVNGGTQGSPPRVRGKAGSHAHAHNERRITPACAGKSRAHSERRQGKWDHPRVCGEKTKKIP